ncbi:host attachment protein [Marinibaculum pumilum]|uniref:Host attachment protein n=1 Tax=Marinibaculum pumilum TaxID=1766165 RepID=A0ABV7KYN5_9PROT
MSGVEIPGDALVLVGDGEKALFLRNRGDDRQANLQVERVLEHPDPPTREQGTDRPGRFNDGPTVARSAVEQTDWHQLEKDRFAGEIAEALYKAAHAGRYDKLIVVAPPKVLGALRKAYHKEVSARLLAEVDKDLTNQPPYEIEKRLKGAA